MESHPLIPFNKPFLIGKETQYINEAVISGKISGNGTYTNKCQQFFEQRYGIKKALLTTSCTDALEMAAILADIKPGDEVIVPSYTFVSSALAFVRQGASIVFADSGNDHPNVDVEKLSNLITNKTKVIVVVHYAGMACDMDAIMKLAALHQLIVVEDAAQAIESFYINNKGLKIPLGSIGHMATFSFHETKNIISGEGGMLAINDKKFIARAEIIWEKGTNRSQFFRGEVDKYSWIDTGSSFLPSEIIAAFLWAQLEQLELIQKKRIHIWNLYHHSLAALYEQGVVKGPMIPDFATNNGHIYYLVLPDSSNRDAFIHYLKSKGIMPVFHYIPLHTSPFYKDKHDGRNLINAFEYSERLVRLPFYYDLQDHDVETITKHIKDFFQLTQ